MTWQEAQWIYLGHDVSGSNLDILQHPVCTTNCTFSLKLPGASVHFLSIKKKEKMVIMTKIIFPHI